MTLVPCYLSNLVIDETAEQQVLFVTAVEGGRRFPIVIGQLEALAIDRAVKGARFPRPLTHDLLMQTIAALGAQLVAVRIVDLHEGTFHAELALHTAPGTEVTIDCRPSDALALLVRQPGTPLLVADTVLAEAAQ